MTTIKDLSNLAGRRALITGATGRLGKVFADSLAELGSDIILLDLPGSDFATLSETLEKRWGVNVEIMPCDLESENQRSEVIEYLTNSGRGLNILVNNAALVGTSELSGWNVPFGEQSLSTWRRALEINLTAVFHLCQGLFPLLKKAEGANIINIASIYGSYAPDWKLYEGTLMGNPAAYGVSKSGIIQLTRWLATTIAPDIRVNGIAPGGILRNQEKSFVDRYTEKTPLKRMAEEDDIRGAVAYLSSDLSRYVTGQILVVDGGFTSH
jgi:NAD(P)-dependent dehydrogenase (short-subunit alcohol dehydrogenase family)